MQLLETSAMSTGNFELHNLSPKVFRHERASNTDFTLASLTELSSESIQWELQDSAFDITGKSGFRLLCLVAELMLVIP